MIRKFYAICALFASIAVISALSVATPAFAAGAGTCEKPMNGTEVQKGQCKFYLSRNEDTQQKAQFDNKRQREAAKAASRPARK
jgi:hypothetical protein